MNKVWVFLGGVAVGIVGLVTTALVCDGIEEGNKKYEDRQSDDKPITHSLPEGSSSEH